MVFAPVATFHNRSNQRSAIRHQELEKFASVKWRPLQSQGEWAPSNFRQTGCSRDVLHFNPFMERAARLIRESKGSRDLLGDDAWARAIWPTAVGKQVASHTSRVHLVRSTLVVEVEDSIWQRQLYPLTAQIVARIRKVSGSNLVEDIEFRVGVPRREPARSIIRDTLGTGAPLFKDEADSIPDPVLKKVYRLSRKKATA